MTVKRIVANIAASNLSEAKHFYEEILELEILLDSCQ